MAKLDPLWKVHTGDARRADRFLAATSARIAGPGEGTPILTATVTSPPYGGLIDYGSARQIGYKQAHDAYLRDCQSVFGHVFRWTKDDGSLWVVVDDYLDRTSASSAAASGRPTAVQPLPFQLMTAASAVGWTLREVIIWHKDKTRPWSHRGRLRNAFEYVLHFVKTAEYKFHVDRLRDSVELGRWWVQYPERYNPGGKVPDNVWAIPIPVQGSWSASAAVQHACPFPPDLVRRVLHLATDPGDVVFDPFSGSGTVAAVAEAMGRKPLGLEINADHVSAYKKIVRPEILRSSAVYGANSEPTAPLAQTLLALRAVKYPKSLISRLRKDPDLPTIKLAAAMIESDSKSRRAHQQQTISTVLVLADEDCDRLDDLLQAAKDATSRAPLTKFGIAGDVIVCSATEFLRLAKGRRLYLYEHGHTWASGGRITARDAVQQPMSNRRGGYPPIVATVEVNVRLPDH
jgi:DNA modification methylase